VTAAAPLSRALDRAAGIAFLLLVASLPGSIAPMGVTAALCGVLTVAVMVRERRIAWPATPVNYAAFGWMAALVLASAFSLDPAHSWPGIKKGLFPLLAGLAALHGRDRRAGERALAVYFAASGVIAVVGIALWVGHGAGFGSRAQGLTTSYMTFAGQLSLMVPVAFSVAVSAKRPRWRWGSALAAVLALAALGVTFTRSAWIATVVACAVVAGVWAPIAVGGIALVAAALFAFAPGVFGARLRSIFDPHNPWNEQRVLMWGAGLRMFRDHPWTGVGLQDLMKLYDQYKAPEATERVGHMHNVYVQIAVNLGVVGLAAFAWLYTSIVRTTTIALRPQLSRRGIAAGLRVGVLATLVGFLFAGLFEWNFGDEELLYGLYTLAGLAWAARNWDAEA
jgi:O-antigen ligase